MATNDYESGLKMLEELTTNARQIQDQLLGEILTKNAGTEYLSRFLHGQNDKRLFRKNVPVVAYEDLKPYIDRIANGEASSDILLAEPLTGFSLSSGTSGGQPKLIPVIDETTNTHTMYNNIFRSVMIKHFGDINQAGKRMELMFVKPDVETPSGLKATAVSSRFFKRSGFRAILPKLYTSPFETIVCPDAKQSMYCQILFGLIQRDEVVMIGSVFASGVLRGFKFLENNWQELCSNIRTGRISDWITDSGCKNAASSILKANSELADLIENICMKSWEGIIRKLWPKTKYIGTICTGAMMQYTAELEFYCGGLPLVSGFYGCSEGAVGINLEPRSKPLDVSYTFLPNSVYFEFVPIKEECVANSPNLVESVETKSSDEDTEPVELVNVKPGQCYELLVTNSTGLYRYRVGDVLMVTGFYNNTPQFRFVGRENVVLSVDLERTSEADLLKAVTEAKTLLDPLGFILTGYTSYGDTSSTPGHYVIFWELKAKESNNGNKLDPKVMEECCSRMEDSLHFTYRMYRRENIIAALEIRVVKQGTFEELMDYSVSQGASLSQYKTPVCIKSKEALEILNSRVIAKFFSPKTQLNLLL
ncbi:indole-3-acetic acid-amido synthetase GH3.17-like [Hibiscus syriacus]|uniref:indole-3-acetic acid-amido synthetase GH3.17-like n=1 Tax=Hibiscus syriacus TaxID=106335 RepID=UPI001922C192|nr:indole-3-acetic acid-amido synthetase GH3.17-like [Hibiscus syriacus]